MCKEKWGSGDPGREEQTSGEGVYMGRSKTRLKSRDEKASKKISQEPVLQIQRIQRRLTASHYLT